MKSAEEIMEILEGFDVTGSYRDAGELAGCSPNTVIRYVAARQAGELVAGRRRVHRPWVPGPGVWAQYECADGLRIAGVLTYPLTDNEKTVTVEQVAGVPVRNPTMVAFARHYGLTVATCMPVDPATKGGNEATVRVAKADLVPTEANLLDQYVSPSWRRRVRCSPDRSTRERIG